MLSLNNVTPLDRPLSPLQIPETCPWCVIRVLKSVISFTFLSRWRKKFVSALKLFRPLPFSHLILSRSPLSLSRPFCSLNSPHHRGFADATPHARHTVPSPFAEMTASAHPPAPGPSPFASRKPSVTSLVSSITGLSQEQCRSIGDSISSLMRAEPMSGWVYPCILST